MSDAEDQDWEAEKQRITEVVDRCCQQIREHVDSVQIFVNLGRPCDSRTMTYEKGSGNWSARLGQIFEWLEIQKQYMRNYAIRRDAENDD